VRINDISISRVHAIVKFQDGAFYLEDNDSKFGTIMLLKDKYRLSKDNLTKIQVGRTQIEFGIKYEKVF